MTYGKIMSEFKDKFPNFKVIDYRPYYPIPNSLIIWSKAGEIAVTYKDGKFELIPNHAKYLSDEFNDLIERAKVFYGR